jgi:hypothetical protein
MGWSPIAVHHAHIAQLVERHPVKVEVLRSIRSMSAKFKKVYGAAWRGRSLVAGKFRRVPRLPVRQG